MKNLASMIITETRRLYGRLVGGVNQIPTTANLLAVSDMHLPVLKFSIPSSPFSILRKHSLFVLSAHWREATGRNQTEHTGAERDAVGERDPQSC